MKIILKTFFFWKHLSCARYKKTTVNFFLHATCSDQSEQTGLWEGGKDTGAKTECLRERVNVGKFRQTV